LLFWLRRARKLGSLVFVVIRKHVRFTREYSLSLPPQPKFKTLF